MRRLIENLDGLFSSDELLEDGRTKKSFPFTRNQTKTRIVDDVEETYNIYDDCITKGFDLVLIPKSKKDSDEAEQAKALIENEVDRIIHLAAVKRGYKTIDSIAKYQNRPGIFRAQCDAMALWVDDCYVACFAIQSKVLAGTRAMPTIEDVAGLLPVFIDPGVIQV
jgi:hypothetical protein